MSVDRAGKGEHLPYMPPYIKLLDYPSGAQKASTSGVTVDKTSIRAHVRQFHV
jgi:hypothetical protein